MMTAPPLNVVGHEGIPRASHAESVFGDISEREEGERREAPTSPGVLWIPA